MTLIKDVKYGSRRSELIFFLLDLMDKKYQEKWLKDNGGYGFKENVRNAFELIIEDLLMEDYIKNNTTPHEQIGYYLKSFEEAIVLLSLSRHLENIFLSCQIDKDFLSSPHLLPMRSAAKECFIEFIKNEKDNKKFCEFVLKVISTDHFFTPNSDKTSYENIINYIQSVNIE